MLSVSFPATEGREEKTTCSFNYPPQSPEVFLDRPQASLSNFMAAGLNYQAAVIMRGTKQTRESESPCLRASLPSPADLAVVFCRHFPFLGRLRLCEPPL